MECEHEDMILKENECKTFKKRNANDDLTEVPSSNDTTDCFQQQQQQTEIIAKK